MDAAEWYLLYDEYRTTYIQESSILSLERDFLFLPMTLKEMSHEEV